MMKRVLCLVKIGTMIFWFCSLFSCRICYCFCSVPSFASPISNKSYCEHDGPAISSSPSSYLRHRENSSMRRCKRIRSFWGNGGGSGVATTTLLLLSSSSDGDNSLRRSKIRPTTSEITQQQQIPVLGPFFNTPPLVIGVSQWLSSPTPTQWKTIEHCIESMHGINNGVQKMATLSAAPLVAILSQHTDIATLAAIVGIAAAEKQQLDSIDDDSLSSSSSSSSSSSIDTTDSSSLQESLARISRQRKSSSLSSSLMYSDNVKVRFLGIGRAKLADFTSISPSQAKSSSPSSYDEDNDDEEEQILVARVNLVLDGPEKGKNDNNEQHDQYYSKKFTSPVHAINELSVLASRLSFLHRDRQKLVQGILAAQTRLDCASEEWEDLDGIGNIFHDDNNSIDECDILTTTTDSVTIREFLAMTMTNGGFATDDEDDDDDEGSRNNLESSVPLSEEALRVSKLENFGLGSTSSAFSSLTSLAKVVTKQLESYYSPSLIESEEFHYCMISWVAVQSLSYYYETLPPYPMIKRSLECCNTIERMQQLYDDMLSHKKALQELAQAKRRELLDCGEECTDLFL